MRRPARFLPWSAPMTAPRRIVENTTYLLTRRCLNRMFLLRPSGLVNAVFQFALAVAAQRYGILIHCFCVLSNHYHCVLTDPFGKLPEFERDLGSILARALNAAHGRWESFWAPGSYSAVALQSAQDILDKMAYVLANPAAAGLVRRGSDWPGLWSAPSLIGADPTIIKRPDHFFRKNGPSPETAKLELVCPPGFDSLEELRKELAGAVKKLEDQAARELASESRSFLGVARILAQKPHARPAPGEPRRALNPRLAARDKWKRIEAICRLKSFLAAYRKAWLAFSEGARSTLFPEGTYRMRVVFGVACAPVT
jgi:REP element-mobilizing transposase RayT